MQIIVFNPKTGGFDRLEMPLEKMQILPAGLADWEQGINYLIMMEKVMMRLPN